MLTTILKIFFKDPWFFLSVAFVMVCALIVLLGAIKKAWINKIPNKDLRGTVSFFSSIVASFVFVAGAFWIKDWNFDYYIWTSVLFSCWTVIVYALYEYTRLRKLIDTAGNAIWNKIMPISAKDTKELKKELNSAFTELTKKTEKNLKKSVVKHDIELDNV